MKKTLAVALCLTLLLGVTGCDAISGAVGGITGAVGEIAGAVGDAVSGPSGDELYSKLDSLLSNPNGSTDLSGKFTFAAKIISEPEEMTFDDDDKVYTYQIAWISRNLDDYFFLDVTDIENRPAVDEIVEITGEVNGTIYWTEDNKQVEILDILAHEVKTAELEKVELNEGPTVAVSNWQGSGEITFLGAHYAKDTFGDAIAVYFEFKNTGSSDVVPPTGSLYYYHGDESVSSTNFGLNEVDPGYLSLSIPATADKTFAGKTGRYYLALHAGEDLEAPFFIETYDDYFNTTTQIIIPIAASLEELTGESTT